MSTSNKMFSGMPSINIPRSRWNDSYNVTGSFKHGYLVPVDAIPILPGDGMAYQLKDITRMQTPIAPIFGNIKQHFVAFFVPMRLVWNHTEEFFGANKTSSGYQTSVYQLPTAQFSSVMPGSLSHYLGKPIKSSSETDADGKTYYEANILKERAYFLIWSEFFRAQQITEPAIINVGDSTSSDNVLQKICTINGSNINPGNAPGTGTGSLMRVAKDFDYFTASTLDAQYGNAVELPLGATAPVYAENTTGSALTTGYTLLGGVAPVAADGIVEHFSNFNSSGSVDPVIGSNTSTLDLKVDLSTATAAKVNDVRYAFAVQKYLERSNYAGNYFFGILQVHYGVTSPDSRLQRPEFLGSWEEDILVYQVVSTADTTNSNVKTSVGNTGAMSVTASGAVNLFNKSFVEPGYVMILRYCRHRQVYSQGVMREDFKKDRFEIYTPELCNLGDQATLTRELYWKAGDSEVFGYQEHWAEYRYRPDRVTGMLDPAGSNSLAFWTLANNFTQKPELDDDFILEGRANLDRALTTASAYDEYVSDTWANITWTREMPVRTIPGLIDHFGAM